MKKNPSFLAPTEKVNETQRKSLGLGKYEKRERHPNEALPTGISFKDQPVFNPVTDLIARSGIARV